MTNPQLQELKSMTPAGRISYYFKKFNAHEISREQYDQALRFCRSLEGDHTRPEPQAIPVSDTVTATRGLTETILSELGGQVIEDKPATQKQRLLMLLSDFCWHDTPSIMTAVYGVGHQGVCRISERIRELKADGHNIESRKKSQTVQEYKLNNPNTLI